MNRLLLTAILLTPGTALADQLTLQLKWLPSAQFAGYYVAEEMGYYQAEGLDLTIEPGGPEIAPTQVLARGAADVIVEWMPAALAAREKGLPLVNIAQPFKTSGLNLVCLKASGISDPKTDFAGKSFGVWFGGNEYPFLNWLSKLRLSPTEVTILPQGTGIELLLDKQAACINAMSYNDWQLRDAGLDADELTIFRLNEHGAATLEDGLYTLDSTLKHKPDELEKFVRASMKGWKYAETNPEETAKIVLKYDKTGPQDIDRQTRLVQDVTKLTKGTDGALDPIDYQNTVETLLSGDSYQVISTAPNAAWTRAITDKALVEKTPVQPQSQPSP